LLLLRFFLPEVNDALQQIQEIQYRSREERERGEEMIRTFVGWDRREMAAYSTFCNSVIKRASQPVSFTPLAIHTMAEYHESHTDGSNDFIYSRFLVPYLCQYEGWAIFFDGDMVCLDDISALWGMRDDRFAVMVAKHDYKTKMPVKYLGAKNEDYPRKNWSSVILWNCGHPANRVLTPRYVENATGADLHQFKYLDNTDLIGEIPIEWNWLAVEYPEIDDVSLVHYTLGIPAFQQFKETDYAPLWWKEYYDAGSTAYTIKGQEE
jgi:lipopolysaccharide biosynthesis glycosyltransferase